MKGGTACGVIVTSAGTASAVNVIKALRAQDELRVRLIAVDADPLAAGLYLADTAAVVPRIDHPDYLNRLRQIATETGAEVLLPIYSRELALFSRDQATVTEMGLRMLISAPATIDLCNDKSAFAGAMARLGVETPDLLSDAEALRRLRKGAAVFAKPRQGSSSRGASVVRTEARLREILGDGQPYVLQPCVDGAELTVDALCDQQSNLLVCSPRYRIQTKGGQSVKARTASVPGLRETVAVVCRSVGIRGVCNLQFFENRGRHVLIELNPRFAAGGLMLTVHAGANVPLLLLKLILGLTIAEDECRARENLYMSRYWQECFFEKTIAE